jgi:hypothetical protein
MERAGLFGAYHRQSNAVAPFAGFELVFGSALNQFLDGTSLFGRAGLQPAIDGIRNVHCGPHGRPDDNEAWAALEEARKVNLFAKRYVSGGQPLPEEEQQYYRPGEESEAQMCALEVASAWARHPEFREWLRGKSPSRH